MHEMAFWDFGSTLCEKLRVSCLLRVAEQGDEREREQRRIRGKAVKRVENVWSISKHKKQLLGSLSILEGIIDNSRINVF